MGLESERWLEAHVDQFFFACMFSGINYPFSLVGRVLACRPKVPGLRSRIILSWIYYVYPDNSRRFKSVTYHHSGKRVSDVCKLRLMGFVWALKPSLILNLIIYWIIIIIARHGGKMYLLNRETIYWLVFHWNLSNAKVDLRPLFLIPLLQWFWSPLFFLLTGPVSLYPGSTKFSLKVCDP